MIKSIDTVYNGNYFRSRLEARWAIFFDQLGIKYGYESQGFVLSNKECYLPDFYLPNFFGKNIYVEIKPDLDSSDTYSWLKIISHEDYNTKWYEFAKENYLMILFGAPSNKEVYVIKTPSYKKDQTPNTESSGQRLLFNFDKIFNYYDFSKAKMIAMKQRFEHSHL